MDVVGYTPVSTDIPLSDLTESAQPAAILHSPEELA